MDAINLDLCSGDKYEGRQVARITKRKCPWKTLEIDDGLHHAFGQAISQAINLMHRLQL